MTDTATTEGLVLTTTHGRCIQARIVRTDMTYGPVVGFGGGIMQWYCETLLSSDWSPPLSADSGLMIDGTYGESIVGADAERLAGYCTRAVEQWRTTPRENA
jgi:hypothetical protein